MKTNKILMSVHGEESRIALIRDGVLENLHIELAQKSRLVGNIYLGTVINIQPSFQAAFVDYGSERNGFLSINDININLFKSNSSRHTHGKPPIQSLLKNGQNIMVQIIKEEIGHKGAALTTNISLAGRFMVFMPNSDKGGISKKIENEEQRNRLKDLIKGLENENAAIIIRTAGINRTLAELKKDYRTLLSQWRKINTQFARTKRPSLIYEEPNIVVRILRDYFTSDIDEVLVDDAVAFQQALELFKDIIPRQQKKLRLYVGDKPLFSDYGIEQQIEQLSKNKVSLKSGGSIVIDNTEALVAIDVNSGTSTQENKIEETALRTNLEAAAEVARQLRLRNLGGLIVIDFIDMGLQKNRKLVVRTLEEALASDKAKCLVDNISQFGLLEMSRQRIGPELSYKTETVCPTCCGKGTIASIITSANDILRKIRDLAAKGNLVQVRGKLPLDLANYLLNDNRDHLRELESEFDIKIFLTADLAALPGQIPKFEIKTFGSYSETESLNNKENDSELKEPINFKKDSHKNYHHYHKKEGYTNGHPKRTYDKVIQLSEHQSENIKKTETISKIDEENKSQNLTKNDESPSILPKSEATTPIIKEKDISQYNRENLENKNIKEEPQKNSDIKEEIKPLENKANKEEPIKNSDSKEKKEPLENKQNKEEPQKNSDIKEAEKDRVYLKKEESKIKVKRNPSRARSRSRSSSSSKINTKKSTSEEQAEKLPDIIPLEENKTKPIPTPIEEIRISEETT